MKTISIMASDPLPTPRGIRRRISFIIMLGLALGLLVISADLVPLAFSPLDRLGIPYPHLLPFAHFLIAGLLIVAWIIFRRSELATGIALLLAIGVVVTVTHWADAQLAKIPVTRRMDQSELTTVEQRLGFKVTETGSADGMFLLVARGNERAATDEAKRLGVFRPQ